MSVLPKIQFLTDEVEEVNPLKPELLEEKERVKEIMNRPLFVRSGATKLKKKNKNDFFSLCKCTK